MGDLHLLVDLLASLLCEGRRLHAGLLRGDLEFVQVPVHGDQARLSTSQAVGGREKEDDQAGLGATGCIVHRCGTLAVARGSVDQGYATAEQGLGHAIVKCFVCFCSASFDDATNMAM